jgi:hypothetical protein
MESAMDRSERRDTRSTIQYQPSFQSVPFLDGPRNQDNHVLQSPKVVRASDQTSPNRLDARRA